MRDLLAFPLSVDSLEAELQLCIEAGQNRNYLTVSEHEAGAEPWLFLVKWSLRSVRERVTGSGVVANVWWSTDARRVERGFHQRVNLTSPAPARFAL